MVLKRAARSALLCKAPFTEAPAVLDAAIDLLMNARSPSTFRGWDLALRRYNYYCNSLRIADKDRWPPTSHVALGFIAFLFEFSDSSSSVTKKALGGIRSICKFLGLDTTPLDSPMLDFALEAFRKSRPAKKKAKRPPITVPILRKLINLVTGPPVLASAAKAIMTLMTYALLRPQDATETIDYPGWFPRREHVTWFDDHFTFHLLRSKTDQYAEGEDIEIYANGSDTCPWHFLLEHWLCAPDQSPSAPLIQFDESGRAMHYSDLLCLTKSLATLAGLDATKVLYSPHSFRIGGATSLAIAGATDYTIKNAGRWSSTSYQLYTRPSAQGQERASRLMSGIP